MAKKEFAEAAEAESTSSAEFDEKAAQFVDNYVAFLKERTTAFKHRKAEAQAHPEAAPYLLSWNVACRAAHSVGSAAFGVRGPRLRGECPPFRRRWRPRSLGSLTSRLPRRSPTR